MPSSPRPKPGAGAAVLGRRHDGPLPRWSLDRSPSAEARAGSPWWIVFSLLAAATITTSRFHANLTASSIACEAPGPPKLMLITSAPRRAASMIELTIEASLRSVFSTISSQPNLLEAPP